MVPSQVDGRTYHCPHCDAQVQAAIDGAQIAAGMHLDLANVAAFMHGLATALRHGFGDDVVVTTGGDGHVAVVEIDFDPHRFTIKRERAKLVGQVKKLVRGVALKTKEHPIPEWVALLHEAIAQQLNDNTRVTEVLARLRIK